MCKKTNDDRMVRIQELAESNIGHVKNVSLKLKDDVWCAGLKMLPGSQFEYIAVTDVDSTEAMKGLKNRLKKIIKRYNQV